MGKRWVYSEALRKSSLNSESLSYAQNGDNHPHPPHSEHLENWEILDE